LYKLINYIKDNLLIKVASLNTFSVLIKIFSGFLTSKAIAVFIGPEGMALIGNFRNFFTTAQSISTLGFYNGAIKYIAELKKNQIELSKIASTIFYFGIFFSILISILCFFNSQYINDTIFSSVNDYNYVIKVLALVLPFYFFNTFVSSIINGFSKFKTLMMVNIVSQILVLLATLLLIYKYKIPGALIAVVISQIVIFMVIITVIGFNKKLIPSLKVSFVRYSYVKKLSKYSIMAIFSAILLPFITIAIRNYIIENIGFREAGFWEAMTRISNYYLMFISSLMAIYILPRFSEINTIQAFRNEVFNFYKTIIPIFGLGLVGVYFLRQYIINIVLTNEFKPVESLFFWQLLGDFVKVLSMIISYQFLAKKMFWYYIITEALFGVLFFITSIFFMKIFGVKGVTIAYFMAYLLHYIILLVIFRKSLFNSLIKNG
jgi:PST family polysaccharide transporter